MNKSLIDHWSYSSMATLLNNPASFKKKYILKQYDDITSPSALVGTAGHKALELYHQGMGREDAILAGQKIIDEKSDIGINYGKTGTREKIIQSYSKAINYAFEELPTFHELLGVEESIVAELDSLSGEKLSIPAKAKMDIINRNELGELEVTDWKFVTSYTDPNIDDFKKWLQGMFNYYVIKAKYGEPPKRIIYREVKLTGNKDGSPQMQPYSYEFNSNADFATFEKLYNECTTQINLPGYQFLPNPSDMFDGQLTFEIYRSGIMGVEAPVAVSHRTEKVDFFEKQFVPSASDEVQNQHFSMEERIRMKLQEFGVPVKMEKTHVGPSVTQYTMKPSRGVRMAKVSQMGPDLSLALEARSLRLEAPIPGTGLIGVEVPSELRKTIELSDQHLHMGTLDLPIGVNVYNEVIYKDLRDTPHMLVAGATNAGKSVFLNVLIKTITKQNTSDMLELILVDPKQVEFAPFEDIPHLIQPVVFDNRGASEVLAKTVAEMEKRYNSLRRRNCRSIAEYNKKTGTRMPYRVIIIDEFADLMMSADKQPVGSMDVKLFNENLMYFISSGNGKLTQKATKAAIKATLENGLAPAEESIVRIAQKARAVGIHLILATQRPSADVVTGLIKANVPTKVAFMTTNKVNSQIVLDETGAEELTGKGDMLFSDPSYSGLRRLQGLYTQ